MDIVFHTIEKACVLVTLAFVLACTGAGARLLETPRRRLPPAKDQAFALLVFC